MGRTRVPLIENLIAAREEWRRGLAASDAQAMRSIQNSYQRFRRDVDGHVTTFIDDVSQLNSDGVRVFSNDVRNLPSFQRLILRVEAELEAMERAILVAGTDIAEDAMQYGVQGAKTLTLAASGPLAPSVGAVMLEPDPQTLLNVLDYANSKGFRDRYEGFAGNSAARLRDSILSLTAQGQNSRAIANHLKGWLTLPYATMENQVRTMQAYSARGAAHATYVANENVIDGWVWFATLDARTCIMCISKHGQKYSSDKILNDHHRGRCTPIPTVIGAKWPDRIQTGREWVEGMTPAQQEARLGTKRYEAMQRGDMTWDDMAQPYTDPIYGEMLRVAPVK